MPATKPKPPAQSAPADDAALLGGSVPDFFNEPPPPRRGMSLRPHSRYHRDGRVPCGGGWRVIRKKPTH